MRDTYLTDEKYENLIAELMSAGDRDTVVMTLAETVGVWPASVLDDPARDSSLDPTPYIIA